MEEIKLRAWHKDNKCFEYTTLKELWINGYHVAQADSFAGRLPNSYINSDHIHDNAFMFHAKWKRCTGLKDKNGKDIYYDDIGKSFGADPVIVDEFLVSMLIVAWITGGEGRTMANIENVPEFEVIGNMDETPEIYKDMRIA